MIAIILLAVAAVAFILYLHKTYSKLSSRGLNHLPVIPVLGNMSGVIMRNTHIIDIVAKTYNTFPQDRFVGHYNFVMPVVIIRDVDLVKAVMVKDFEHFINRSSFFDETSDALFGRNLLSLKGNEWKDMRSTLSPAFTSSKIRMMVPFMVEIGEQMIISIKKGILKSQNNYIDVEAKDLATRYANDVIASVAFGIRVNSLDEDNYFYETCKKVTTFTFSTMLKVFGFSTVPTLMKKLNVSIFSEEVKTFFTHIVLDTMRHREEKHIVRNDMIHLLMEAKKGRLSHDTKSMKDDDAGFATVEESTVGKKQVQREWSDIDLVAQAVLFLFAGFDTVSTAMAFCLHELALNPDVQDRLAREIREDYDMNNGKVDYNSIQQLTYLDMVISEVLRKWPAASLTDRLCVKDYNLGKPNKKATQDYIIRKGENIQIPIWALHYDPEYFPFPQKFDPERFSEENKHKIHPFAYMPFGLGPRNCIGSRFALCELKVMVYQLLLHIEVSPCERTSVHPKLSKDGFSMKIEGGHWVRMKIR